MKGFVITTAGETMLARAAAGETLTITQVAVGKGVVASLEAAKALTALVDQVALGTSSAATAAGSQVSMTVEYRNDMGGGLETGFTLSEFGIFASAGDDAAQLLYYASLGDDAAPVQPISDGLDVHRYPVAIAVTGDVTVTLAYPPGGFVLETRKINDKPLSADVTLTGADIAVSASDATKIAAALSNKADKLLSYNNGDITSIPKVSGTYSIGPDVTGMPFSGGCLAQVASDGYSVAITVWFGNTQYIRVGSGEVWDDWDILATATPPQVYDLPLAEGISNINGTMSKYWMNQDSTVHVEISVQATSELTDESLVSKLPEGFLPAENQPRYIGDNAFLTVQTGGEVQLFLRGGGSLPVGKWICVEFNYEANLQM